MKVVILGGAGGVGQAVAQTVANMNEVSELLIADLSLDAASRVADDCGPKAKAQSVDVRDGEALTRALSDYDLVLNTVGPFYRFGLQVLDSAIDAGCDYADVCDDWEPTLEMLERHNRAQDAGVTSIIGLGASPGISNLLAVEAATALDTVESLITAWNAVEDFHQAEQESKHSAAAVHWMQQISGTIRVVEEGRLTDVKPLQEIELQLPEYGSTTVWTVGHPEPLTLKLHFPQLRHSVNAMTGDVRLMRLLQDLTKEMEAGLDPDGAAQELYRRVAHLDDLQPAISEQGELLPNLCAVATGQKDGRELVSAAAVRAVPPGATAGVTAVPLALAVPLFASGVFERPGVFTPEQVVPSDRFFNLLAPYCVPSFTSVEELVWRATGPVREPAK